ncbi:MAG: hypothetical protein ACFHWX_16285 [Bacteroidota bacterium]
MKLNRSGGARIKEKGARNWIRNSLILTPCSFFLSYSYLNASILTPLRSVRI